MPILDLQKRARELGRIRIGQKGAKGQPQKLDKFRLTSASKPLLDKVAELYGGTVQQWTPTGGAPQWEVITDAKRIPIMVPPQPVSQWYETWTAGGCVHRCDGETDWITGEACDNESKVHKESKPTTRLNVILRDVEGIGVWRLESHGWNAAVELPQAADFLAQAGGYVNGWVALEERVSKLDGQTRRFVVPTIEIAVTPAELMAGKGRVQAPQVEGPVARAAIEAGPTGRDWLADAQAATTLDGLRAVWNEVNEAKAGTPELYAELRAIGDRLANPVAPTEHAVEQPPDDGAQQDKGYLWHQVLAAAGELDMDLSMVEQDFASKNEGFLPSDASAVQLGAYLTDLQGRAAA